MNISDYLTRRYQGYPPNSWFTLSHSGPQGWEYQAYNVANLPLAVAEAEARANENTYATLAVFKTRPKAQGEKSEVLESRWLWVDLDSNLHDPELPTMEQLQERIASVEPAPTLVLMTGRGYHLEWELNAAITDRLELEEKNNWLNHKLGVNNCMNINRTFRIAGTMNTKAGTPCEVVVDNGVTYDSSDFGRRSLGTDLQVEANYNELPDDFLEVLKKRNSKLYKRILSEETAIKDGAKLREDGHVRRYVNDSYIASTMLSLGYEVDEIASVLYHPTWLSGSKGRERGWSYVERTIAYALSQKIRQGDTFVRGENGKFNAWRATTNIIDAHHIKFYLGAPYAFNGRAYVPGLTGVIAAELWSRLGEDYLSKHVVEVEKIIEQRKDALQVQDNDADNWVCVENGLLNLITRELVPHTPKIFVPNMFPIVYDPGADSSTMLKYFGSTLTEGVVDTFVEHIGHCLTTEVIYPCMLFLSGDGASGKSQLLRVVEEFLGPENCSNSDFGSLTSETPYGLGNLVGMRANVVYDDAVSGRIHYVGRIKSLIQNEPVQVRIMWRQPWKQRLTLKFFFGVNDIAEIKGVDDAIARRVLNLVCDKLWKPGKEGFKPNVGVNLIAQQAQRSALLNAALDGLDRLRTNGDYTRSEGVKKAHHQWLHDATPLVAFIDDCCRLGEGERISVDELYKHYLAYYKDSVHESGIGIVGKTTFNRRLEAMSRTEEGFKVQKTHGIAGSMKFSGLIWKGIDVAEKQFGKATIKDASGKTISVEGWPKGA